MINKTVLQGRLARDPELRTTQSGVEVVSLTIAWSEKYKDVESKLFLNCTAWRQTGVFINTYFKKGQEIWVEGKLETRSYQDKDGNNRSVTELIVDKAHFCGKKSDGQASATQQSQQSFNVDGLGSFEDIDASPSDLPF